MTPAEKRQRARLERRLRAIERLLAATLALSIATTALAITLAAGPKSEPEATEPAPQEKTQEEVKTPAEPEIEDVAPRYDITDEELDIVARVVHSEAVGEGFDGQALVAQCILNTAEAKNLRPDEVVLAPGQYAAPAEEASDEVKRSVAAVFLEGYQVTTEPVQYFYSPDNTYSEWHETALEYVGTWGGHRFFKMQ